MSRISPQGLKPKTHLAPFSARLKSYPDTKHLQIFAGIGLFASFWFFLSLPTLMAQDAPAVQTPEAAPVAAGPIAIIPLDSKNPDAGAKVTGALEVSQGKAVIAASGTVTAGSSTTQVILPRRGVLRVCAST